MFRPDGPHELTRQTPFDMTEATKVPLVGMQQVRRRGLGPEPRSVHGARGSDQHPSSGHVWPLACTLRMSLVGCLGRNSQLPDHGGVKTAQRNLFTISRFGVIGTTLRQRWSEICTHISHRNLAATSIRAC